MRRAVLRTEGRIVRVNLILLDILLSKSSLESGIDEAWRNGPAAEAHGGERAKPVATGASLLEFEVVQRSTAS